jgi:hypothetical protein
LVRVQSFDAFRDEFSGSDSDGQADVLQQLLPIAKTGAVGKALNSAPADVKAEAAAGIFAGASPRDRKQLYLTVIVTLALLSLVALVGGMIAIIRGVDSAAFFTLAGLALGGLTGLLAPSPASAQP